MYVDESGDSGISGSPTRYFVLTAMVIHELHWHNALGDLIQFRQHLRITKNLSLKDEIHAAHFISKPGSLVHIKRNDRLDILKQCIDWAAKRKDISITTVIVDKSSKKNNSDIFEKAWKTLIQRFHNTMANNNFPIHESKNTNSLEMGIVLPDNTDGQKLQKLVRKMRAYNPIPNIGGDGFRNLPINLIIEDPLMKDSSNSFFIQMVDVYAYCAKQLYEPNVYMKKKGAHHFYERLGTSLNRKASSKHQLGIVEV